MRQNPALLDSLSVESDLVPKWREPYYGAPDGNGSVGTSSCKVHGPARRGGSGIAALLGIALAIQAVPAAAATVSTS
jgi:hypothetical protein